jgi:hypothetical protein
MAMRYDKNVVDMKYELERDRKTARRKYSASIMSSTKWRILIKAVVESSFRQMIIKFIDDEREYTAGGFNLHVPYQYVDVVSGPRPLISIEWIEFPRIAILRLSDNSPAEQIPQDLDLVKAAISATGKRYTLEETERGFRVIGHVF